MMKNTGDVSVPGVGLGLVQQVPDVVADEGRRALEGVQPERFEELERLAAGHVAGHLGRPVGRRTAEAHARHLPVHGHAELVLVVLVARPVLDNQQWKSKSAHLNSVARSARAVLLPHLTLGEVRDLFEGVLFFLARLGEAGAQSVDFGLFGGQPIVGGGLFALQHRPASLQRLALALQSPQLLFGH